MIIGHKYTTEAMDYTLNCVVVGEHSGQRRRYTVRYIGASRKANVGISNDNAGEKPARRKTKDSLAMLISWGLVGT